MCVQTCKAPECVSQLSANLLYYKKALLVLLFNHLILSF